VPSGSHDSDFGSHVTETPTARAAIPETLVAGAVSDRCVSCGAPLSSDQRYCVVCGERRGAPRFSLPASTAAEAPATPPASAAPARGGRFSSPTTLVAGVGTLLLAMLVGVLIGHDTAAQGSRTVAAAPVRIITTGGGSSGSTSGSGSAAATPTTAAKHPSTSSKKAGAGKAKGKTATPKAAKKTVKAEQGAATKVLGGSGTPPATVTVGSTGTGKGYSKKTHKFTGSFFGQ
jgi:hypothetical protein